MGIDYGADQATIKQLKEKLVIANQILDYLKLATPFGHISARIPGTDNFLISTNFAPGLITSEDQILVCDLNGKVIEGKYPRTYAEVAIHTGVYRKRKDVDSVAHSHTPNVIALTLTETPLSLTNVEALDLGPGPIALHRRTAMIDKPQLGEEVCDLLGPNKAVMLKGHGAMLVGRSIEEALYATQNLEAVAMFQVMATSLGKIVPLTNQDKEALLQFHKTAAEQGGGFTRWFDYYASRVKK